MKNDVDIRELHHKTVPKLEEHNRLPVANIVVEWLLK